MSNANIIILLWNRWFHRRSCFQLQVVWWYGRGYVRIYLRDFLNKMYWINLRRVKCNVHRLFWSETHNAGGGRTGGEGGKRHCWKKCPMSWIGVQDTKASWLRRTRHVSSSPDQGRSSWAWTPGFYAHCTQGFFFRGSRPQQQQQRLLSAFVRASARKRNPDAPYIGRLFRFAKFTAENANGNANGSRSEAHNLKRTDKKQPHAWPCHYTFSNNDI